jgi:drug/metabolite transporter (DMT)-like permease
MAVGLGLGERPSALALAGAGCAVVAIGLVSMGAGSAGSGVSGSVVLMALGAGALFGAFFVLLAQTADDSGLWAFVSVRGASIPLGLALMAGRRQSLRLPRRVHGWVAAAGAGDIGANALFLLATREGLLSVVAPLAALYPVSTVLLALALDKERLRPIQFAGLGLAATALVLTAV